MHQELSHTHTHRQRCRKTFGRFLGESYHEERGIRVADFFGGSAQASKAIKEALIRRGLSLLAKPLIVLKVLLFICMMLFTHDVFDKKKGKIIKANKVLSIYGKFFNKLYRRSLLVEDCQH